MESMLFGRRLWDSLFINRGYDEVWAIPQIAPSSLPFLQSLRRCPGRVVPFVWDPMFLSARARRCPSTVNTGRAAVSGKRLTVMEPNHDVVKFCVYPMLIIDEAYRRDPDAICFTHVTNALHLAHDSPEFVMLMNYLDIVRAGKASFVGRFDTPLFLAELTDIVVSHQWSNPLNYFYFDVCWQGYPLVHNASLAPDLGYYYPDNDVQQGADARCARCIRTMTTGKRTRSASARSSAAIRRPIRHSSPNTTRCSRTWSAPRPHKARCFARRTPSRPIPPSGLSRPNV